MPELGPATVMQFPDGRELGGFVQEYYDPKFCITNKHLLYLQIHLSRIVRENNLVGSKYTEWEGLTHGKMEGLSPHGFFLEDDPDT